MDKCKIVNPEESLLVIIDIQEKFIPIIKDIDKIISNTIFLVKVAKLFDIPIIYTEQNPKKLGKTDNRLLPELKNVDCFSKMTFSIWRDKKIREKIIQTRRNVIILAGIETYVCILQSALDLIKAGFDVYLPVDTIGASDELNHKVAIDRIAAAGAIVGTKEMLTFEFMESADSENFKKVLKLFKEKR